MTDASAQIYDLKSWQDRLGAAPNRIQSPEQRLKDALIVARDATNGILAMRERAVKHELKRRNIAGKLWDRFVNPFRLSDDDTTLERSQTEQDIRQSLIMTEGLIGGRLFERDPSIANEKLTHSFFVDDLGDAVWVYRPQGRPAVVTRYHFGLEDGDTIFKVQSEQDPNGAALPSSVARTLISLRELGRVAYSLALLRDNLYSVFYKMADTSARPTVSNSIFRSHSMPIDYTVSDQRAA